MNPFRKLLISTLTIAAVAIEGLVGKELRPSVHGLLYQTPQKLPDTKHFFRQPVPAPPPAFVWPTESSAVDLAWWRSITGHQRSHEHPTLLVVSIVCGAIGLAMVVASAVVFIYFKMMKMESEAPKSNNDAISD